MGFILFLISKSLDFLCAVLLLFYFLDGRYDRAQKDSVYIPVKVLITVILLAVNTTGILWLCFLSWLLATAFAAFFLYRDKGHKPIRRVLEVETLVLCLSGCEAAAGLLIQGLFEVTGSDLFPGIKYYLYNTVTMILILCFYYIVTGLLKKKGNVSYSKQQYIAFFVILSYSLVNIMITAYVAGKDRLDPMWAVNIAGIVIANIYLLYFIKTTADRNYFESRASLLEQQAKLQYAHYQSMKEKQEKTMRVLHDINRHIRAVEKLYAAKSEADALEYAKKIDEMLQPLVPKQYTENLMFNILLTDKEEVMREQGIRADITIDTVYLGFLDPMDITIIFGNLLDNAIEAAKKAEGDRYIRVRIGFRHKMLVAGIENSCGPVKWKNGNPVSEKGADRGIGLINVRQSIAKYDGSLSLKQVGSSFVAELFLNE